MRLKKIRHSYLLTAAGIGEVLGVGLWLLLGLPVWLGLLVLIASAILAELAWLKFSDWFLPWLKAGEREPP